MIDWDKLPNFSKHEFDCKHTGLNEMQFSFLLRLQALRTELGRPMSIKSGYRHETHPIEAKKARGGAHTTGRACDIACTNGGRAFEIISLAIKHGFTGIGIGLNKGFIHLDDIQPNEIHLKRPSIWLY